MENPWFSRNAPRTQQLAPTAGQGFKNSQGAMATKFDVEKFNGANDFGLWKIKMEAILIQMSGAMTQEEKKKMGDKARSAIILCLGDKVLREVAKEKTAAEIWAKLESLYMTRSLAHRLCLKQQLFSFKMSELRTIEEQIAEFSKIVDDLENIEVKLEDEDKAVILLNALPKTFEHFRDALLYGKDQVITLEEVLTSIRTKEFQKLQDSKTTEEGASGLISVKGKGKKQSGKEKKLNPDGTKQKMGHIKKFCPEKGKAGRPQETADVAEASEGYESAGVLVASSEDPQRSWVMDSGCSYHMCPVKEFFENLDQKEHGNVLLGNNKACRVQGVGSVRLKMFDNREMVLQAVRYVPELKRNLISISAFDLGGYTTKVEDGVMRVCSGDSVVAKGRRRNDLYILEGSTVIGHVSVASGTENTARLWHLRMGHISEKGLEELEKQDLLLGDKLQKLDFCDHCVLGKSHRIPFGRGKHSTERPFEYVHADLWGPARTLTHGGGAYFLSIIDDFSRRVWIYVLKNKSETFQKFKEWHTQIENQLGCRLKCLRTDNGLEFVSEEFNGFCKEKRIRRHRTVVGTPQQNGLAERMNRTILERVRCMLLGSGLSKAFWGEAANTAVYLINRSPSSALNFKTPMEVWSGRPADYSHLRVFGSLAFAHVRGDKLDSQAAKCIFLGYAEGVKGYRLWRLDSPSKLIISRDVIFDETRMAMHPENSGSEKKILVEVEHTTNGADTPGGTEENQMGEGQVENGRTIEENRSDEFRTDLGDDTDGMSGEGSHGKAAGVDLRNYQLVRDRERRISKPTKRLGEADLICYALNAAEDLNRSDEPRSYKEALDSSDRHLWQGAMEEELEALKKNSTWRLVDLPKGKKVIGSKWIFKKKEATPGGEKAMYKARLVAKGFTQIEGVDYHEIFAPVVKHCSVRVLMAIVAHCNLHLEQLDVRTTFLHGDLEETIYMKQPDGFAVDDRVCLLQKSLYGLKQSPRQWYRKFDDFLIKLNFKRCNYDDCVYTLNHDGEMLYLLLYVDDILIASSDKGMIGETKARLADAFEMKELGEARRILGIDIKRDRPGDNLFLSQECYLQKVISRYRMTESKMASTPVGQHLKLTKEQCPKTEEERKKMESVPFSNGIGSIMYGMVCTRPDVAHGVSVLSQFMVNPGPTHWEALKWMLRYIRGSLGTGLSFQNNFQGGGYIEGFVDSDFAGCMDTRKSRSGYVFTLFGTAVSWRSTLQSVVALSTTEAEYYDLAEGVKEALWLKGLKSVCVHCDSQSAIHLANHQIYHSRTKHIDVKLHFVRNIVESGDVQICKIASEENPTDMLTKPLAKERFLLLLSRIGCLPVDHCRYNHGERHGNEGDQRHVVMDLDEEVVVHNIPRSEAEGSGNRERCRGYPLPIAASRGFAKICKWIIGTDKERIYWVFLKEPSLYAFKELTGRLAVVGVHIALLLVRLEELGSVIVPQGLNFVVCDVLAPFGFLSSPTKAFNTEVHVKRFYMDYYKSLELATRLEEMERVTVILQPLTLKVLGARMERNTEGRLEAIEITMEGMKAESATVRQDLQQTMRILGTQDNNMDGHGGEMRKKEEGLGIGQRGRNSGGKGWSYPPKRFFDIQKVEEEEMVELAYVSMEGSASIKAAMISRFGGGFSVTVFERLATLRQEGTMEDYVHEFEMLVGQTRGMSEEQELMLAMRIAGDVEDVASKWGKLECDQEFTILGTSDRGNSMTISENIHPNPSRPSGVESVASVRRGGPNDKKLKDLEILTEMGNLTSSVQLEEKINYDNWCLHMMALLGFQELWDIVEMGTKS
ncbi:hypothetical protein V8G54_018702 [Vigna mungo]|uniref:Integrase catalytic domain-containing protein n=1 Tax=Vigna mungo TaxID=3915 RepID=A0AAQ3RUZ8_VIGMU